MPTRPTLMTVFLSLFLLGIVTSVAYRNILQGGETGQVLPLPPPPVACPAGIPLCGACTVEDKISCKQCCRSDAGGIFGTPGTCCECRDPCNLQGCCQNICKQKYDENGDGMILPPESEEGYEECILACYCGNRPGGDIDNGKACFKTCMAGGDSRCPPIPDGDPTTIDPPDPNCCRSVCIQQYCPVPGLCNDQGGSDAGDPPTSSAPGGTISGTGPGSQSSASAGASAGTGFSQSSSTGGGTTSSSNQSSATSRGGSSAGTSSQGASSTQSAGGSSQGMSQGASSSASGGNTSSAGGAGGSSQASAGSEGSAASEGGNASSAASQAASAGGSSAGGGAGSSQGGTTSSSSSVSSSPSVAGYCCIASACIPSISCGQTIAQCAQQCGSADSGAGSSSGGSQSSTQQSSSQGNQCSACGACGNGFFNVCDEQECAALGPCSFIKGIFTNQCVPDPAFCDASLPPPSSSSSSSISSSVASSHDSSQSTLSSAAASSQQSTVSSFARSSAATSSAGSRAASSVDLVGSNFCGNGFIDPGEDCDDGNLNNVDACSNACRRTAGSSTALCGNNVLDTYEQCDDGNARSGDGCSGTCILESGTVPLCGDGIINLGELCDDGNTIDTDACSNRCLLGNRRDCAVHAQCASNLCISGRCAACVDDTQCSGGNVCTNGKCLPLEVASISDICGDGIIGAHEECDDGNGTAFANAGANARDMDGCSAQCLLEQGSCGDGILQSQFEQCEPSLHNPSLPYQCTATCRFLITTCGNESVELGEECDMGRLNSSDLPDRCREDCSAARCGDAILDSAEICDDGNRLSGDGCDVYCRRESPAATSTVIDLPFIGNTTYLPTEPIDQTHAPIGDTGPAVLGAMATGAAAGYAWMKRKRRKS